MHPAIRHTLVLLSLVFPMLGFSSDPCFIVSDDTGKAIQEAGDCATRTTPASTFKIALALMGFDSGILKSPTDPVWKYKPEYSNYLKAWTHDQTPRSWIENSVVWYSQLLTQQLGMKKFQAYVDMFDYGNKDLSGDPGKDDGLTNAWLNSSLKISPEEQIVFLSHLVHHDWKLSAATYTHTQDVLQRGMLTDGWKLYGKTGSATPIGWFVGWIEKEGKTYLFAYLRNDEPKSDDPVGRANARVEDVKAKLIEFVKTK